MRRFAIAQLLLRITVGGMMAYQHGWPKLAAYEKKFNTFIDPLGIGNEFSYILVVFAEFFASIAVALGLFTRFACIPNIITMLVAAFIVHGDDPFSKKELAIFYAVGFTVIALLDGGTYSIDAWRKKRVH